MSGCLYLWEVLFSSNITFSTNDYHNFIFNSHQLVLYFEFGRVISRKLILLQFREIPLYLFLVERIQLFMFGILQGKPAPFNTTPLTYIHIYLFHNNANILFISSSHSIASTLTLSRPPAPLRTWSQHSLPVTQVAIGVGKGISARVFSVSLDHTLKVEKKY